MRVRAVAVSSEPTDLTGAIPNSNCVLVLFARLRFKQCLTAKSTGFSSSSTSWSKITSASAQDLRDFIDGAQPLEMSKWPQHQRHSRDNKIQHHCLQLKSVRPRSLLVQPKEEHMLLSLHQRGGPTVYCAATDGLFPPAARASWAPLQWCWSAPFLLQKRTKLPLDSISTVVLARCKGFG